MVYNSLVLKRERNRKEGKSMNNIKVEPLWKPIVFTIGALVVCWLVMSIVASVLVSCGVYRWEIIEHRAPLLILDVATGTVAGWDEPYEHLFGYDQHGGYIGYRYTDGVQEGDKVLTLFLYNPLNNWCDDIMERWDVAVWN